MHASGFCLGGLISVLNFSVLAFPETLLHRYRFINLKCSPVVQDVGRGNI